MKKDYVVYDLLGRAFNGKFPPDYDHNGALYHGYANDTEESIFYDFAVQGYDLGFSYNGKRYWFMTDEDGVYLSDEVFSQKLDRFSDGNDVIEHFLIDGVSLIKLVSQLEDVEVF